MKDDVKKAEAKADEKKGQGRPRLRWQTVRMSGWGGRLSCIAPPPTFAFPLLLRASPPGSGRLLHSGLATPRVRLYSVAFPSRDDGPPFGIHGAPSPEPDRLQEGDNQENGSRKDKKTGRRGEMSSFRRKSLQTLIG